MLQWCDSWWFVGMAYRCLTSPSHHQGRTNVICTTPPQSPCVCGGCVVICDTQSKVVVTQRLCAVRLVQECECECHRKLCKFPSCRIVIDCSAERDKFSSCYSYTCRLLLLRLNHARCSNETTRAPSWAWPTNTDLLHLLATIWAEFTEDSPKDMQEDVPCQGS